MNEDTFDVLIACVGVAWLIALAFFGAASNRGSRAVPGRPTRSWPWVVALPAVLILGCLAYFLFGGP